MVFTLAESCKLIIHLH